MLELLNEELIAAPVRVTCILSARVPILLMHHQAGVVNLSADVAAWETRQEDIAALLRAYAMSDVRVRPLALSIKKWSEDVGVCVCVGV